MEICNDELEEKIQTLIENRMRCSIEPVDACRLFAFANKNIAFAMVETEYFIKSQLYVFWQKNGKLKRKKIIETFREICRPDISYKNAYIRKGIVYITVDFSFSGHCSLKRKPRDVIVLCHSHPVPLTIPLRLFK